MRTLIFAGIILASSAALAQSPAQKAIGIGCYEFYLDLDRCFRYDAVPGKQFSCNLDTYKISTGELVGRISYFESCPGGPITGGGNNDGH